MRLRPRQPDIPTASETVEEASEDQFELVKLIMQLAILDQKVRPLMSVASKKLITDLLDSGCDAQKLGKKVGRNAGFIHQVRAGKKALTPMQFTVLVRYAFSSGQNNDSK